MPFWTISDVQVLTSEIKCSCDFSLVFLNLYWIYTLTSFSAVALWCKGTWGGGMG
jgi:hypothetical protein